MLVMTNLSSGSVLTVTDVLVGLFASLLCDRNFLDIGKLIRSSLSKELAFLSFNLFSNYRSDNGYSGNLVLSLGMVETFNSKISEICDKDPLDIVFMFWAVSVGIANGVANIKVSLTATIIGTILLLALNRIPFGMSAFIVIVKYKEESEEEIIKL